MVLTMTWHVSGARFRSLIILDDLFVNSLGGLSRTTDREVSLNLGSFIRQSMKFNIMRPQIVSD
jgi:hypothetical protein